MAEIASVPQNGMTVASTFSGCGGSCLGFRWAGFRTVWANEFILAARETYAANFPDVPIDGRDLRAVEVSDILAKASLTVGHVDVLEGSPPCSSFSMAGRREKSWGVERAYSKTKQRTDDLFFEFARILAGLRPRAFVAENVSGLAVGKARGYFKEIHRALADCGYDVEARMLDAQRLGVPQVRRRVIFVGIRCDLGLRPVFPNPLPYRYSVRDALAGLNGISGNLDAVDISRFAIGREWDRVQPGRASSRYFNLVKAHPEKPCPTVTQTAGLVAAAGVVHPFERRKFTIAELRRICGFPDDFVLTGAYSEQQERLGRAVPPPMMKAVAEALAGVLSGAGRETC